MKKLLGTLFTLILVLALAPTALAAKDADDVAYPAEGGNIYIDESTKTVTDADTRVTSVTIPNGITSIGEYAFAYCRSLTSVTIPDSVTSIGDCAFDNCKSLTEVTIPGSVTSIGDCAFSSCSSLTGMTIPDSVMRIGASAFNGCTSLTGVTISNSIKSIEKDMFWACHSLTNVTIPKGVTSVGDSAFEFCHNLTSVTIPDGVTSIGEYAFSSCSSLKNVTIPDSVTSIGAEAFRECASLTGVTIPGGVTNIEPSTFQGCTALTGVTISNGIASIGGGAFAKCSSLKSVTLPNSVTSIGATAFWDCTALTGMTIPDSVTSIEASAFYGCTSLTGVTVSSGNPSYVAKDGVLFTADGQTLHTYPAGKAGKTYTIPNGVTYIEEGAFGGCPNLAGVTIPDSVTYIKDGAFENCTGLTGVTIPNGVRRIGSYAFSNCSSLVGVTISNSVTRIDNLVFAGCSSLTSIFIPESVTYIGHGGDYGAFLRCEALTDIYFGGTEAQWTANHGNESCYYITIHFNATAPAGFTDLADWNEAPVNWAVGNKFANPKNASVFGAEDPCPRWEVVDILWKAKGCPKPTVTSVPFPDVSPSAPYYEAVCWAYENKIVNGKENGFCPNDTVKRCEAMTIIHRAAGEPTAPLGTSFPDVPGNAYYISAISWAVSRSTPIANGKENGFCPEDPVKRSEMVTFLYRWLVENK